MTGFVLLTGTSKIIHINNPLQHKSIRAISQDIKSKPKGIFVSGGEKVSSAPM